MLSSSSSHFNNHPPPPPSSSIASADHLLARTMELSPFQPSPPPPANNTTTTSRVLLNEGNRGGVQQEGGRGGATWEEHPCELCNCVLYSMEELRNHIAGKRHQKALRNKEWYKSQQAEEINITWPLTRVEENEVLLTTTRAAVVVSGGREGVGEGEQAGDNDKNYTPSSAIMRQYPTEWVVIPTGFKCTICGCNVNSEGSMDMHLRGSGHKKKKDNMIWQQNATATATAAVGENDTNTVLPTRGAVDGDDDDEGWDMTRVPEMDKQFINWDDNRGYVCSCCGAACCTIDTLLMHLKGKKHTSKSRWYKISPTAAVAVHHQNGGGDETSPLPPSSVITGQSRVNNTTTGGSYMNNGSIFDDHTIWEETQYGWKCKLCDASVNAEPMALAHTSSRKHQNKLIWAKSTTCGGITIPAAGGTVIYQDNDDEGFQEQCTHQFYGNGDKALQCGCIGDDRAPAHNNWNDSRCKLCQTGDICGFGAWYSHFIGKVHKKNVRMNRYEYDAVWQRLNAEGFEYYYDHLTGLWDSTAPIIEGELGVEDAFRQDGILYIRDISTEDARDY